MADSNLPPLQSSLHKVMGPTEVRPDADSLHSRVAVITGGPTGIGYEISRNLAAAGCRVIMINEIKSDGDEAIAAIKKETPDAKVEWKGCDISRPKEAHKFFTELAKKLDRLDFLVLSAGKNANKYAETPDGIDSHFATNVLGNHIATNALWPVLRKTAQHATDPAPRVCFESSEMHRLAPGDTKFRDLNELNNPDLNPVQYYARTKLAQILIGKYILLPLTKSQGAKIYVTSVHPGAVKTRLQNQWKEAFPGVVGNVLFNATILACRDPEQGAFSGLWALLSPDVETKGYSGGYFTDPGVEGKETKQACDEELGSNLEKLLEELAREKGGFEIKWE